MAQKTTYNWNNSFVQCGEEYNCLYKNNICFNPSHMNVKNYERHFKSKSSIITTGRFKKFINHYLPGDNVLYAIIEQTRFFKRNEIEIIVKTWEENWMSGVWSDAITHADTVLEKQEFFPLVKIVLNYVRIFVISDAKYATQDYVKAVMLQEYVGDIFTEEDYNVLTKPWLNAKRAVRPHVWNYKNRHLNVDTVDLTDIRRQVQSEVKPSQVKENIEKLETEPDFIQDNDFISEIMSGVSTYSEYNFWEGEALLPTFVKAVAVENATENSLNETYDSKVPAFISVSTSVAGQDSTIEDTQEYTFLPDVLKTKTTVENIIKEIGEENKATNTDVIHNVKKTVDNISSNFNIKNITGRIKNYLGYDFKDNYSKDNYPNSYSFEENNNEFYSNEEYYDNVISEVDVLNVDGLDEELTNSGSLSLVPSNSQIVIENYEEPVDSSHVFDSNVSDRIAELPEHLRDILKVWYTEK